MNENVQIFNINYYKSLFTFVSWNIVFQTVVYLNMEIYIFESQF